jgi:hypothetical protein
MAKPVLTDTAVAAKNAPAGGIVFTLADGSHLSATPAAEEIVVQTPYGEMRLKWTAIRTSVWDSKDGTARFVLRNGDQLTGRVTVKTIEVKPEAAGAVTIPVANLRQVTGADYKGANALRFDGKQNYVEVPHDESLEPKQGLTLECWFKTNTLENTTMVGKRRWNEAGDHGYQLHVSGGVLYGYWEGKLLTGGLVSDGQWHHGAMTWDGKTRRLFLDGALVGEDMPGPWTPSDVPFRIGAVDGGPRPGHHFDGTIGPVRLSKSDRYHGQKFTPETRFPIDAETIACWNFAEGLGEKLLDETAGGHDGKFAGDPPPVWVEEKPVLFVAPASRRIRHVPGQLFPSIPPGE